MGLRIIAEDSVLHLFKFNIFYRNSKRHFNQLDGEI